MTTDAETPLASFGIDERLLRVLHKQGIVCATPVQAQAVPLALLGKDVLAQARTGSGKTLAYLLPVLHQLLLLADQAVPAAPGLQGVRALIVVPTAELARQVAGLARDLLAYAPRSLSAVVNLCAEDSLQMQRTLLSGAPPIVVCTPGRLLPHVDAFASSGGKGHALAGLRFLVVDEADLVLSFGHRADIERLAQTAVPKTVQTLLLSATLSADVDALQRLVLRNPATVVLADGDERTAAPLQQFCIRCAPEDRYLLMYVVLKLRLLQGKLLVFAGDVSGCMRLKLFLDQFGVRACVLNAELPLASRHHIIDEFNRGVYDILIATDDAAARTQPVRRDATREISGNQSDAADGESDATPAKRVADQSHAAPGGAPRKGKRASDADFGVARGVDFRRVDVVVNFDLPHAVDAYVHRVGRTARGGRSGSAISLLCSPDDEAVWAAICADQVARGAPAPSDHPFDLGQLAGFRYRCADALRRVTPAAVHKARLRAVRDELCRSERLRSFFAERPRDLALLRHDNVAAGVVRAPAHLRNVPSYLLGTQEAGGQPEGASAKTGPLPARISAAAMAVVATDAPARKRTSRPRAGVLRTMRHPR